MKKKDKIKNIAPLVMLSAGAVAAIYSLWNHVSFGAFLRNVGLALLIFYILGCVVQEVVARNFKDPEDPEEQPEGEGEEGAAEGEEAPEEEAENLNTEPAEEEEQ